MENPINYIMKPSLKDMVLVQIAVAMWKHMNVRDTVKRNQRIGFMFFPIKGKIIEKVEQLKQPQVFQEEIKRFVSFIGKEIENWVDFHCKVSLLNQSDLNLPAEFCFTPYGTIDKKKTAATIVKDKSLDVYQRYRWACIYCLKDDIWELWNKMSQDCQKSFLNEYSLNNEMEHLEEELLNQCNILSKYSQNMVRLWTLAIKKDQLDYPLSFPNLLDILYCSARIGNKSAVEYFLQGLKHQSSVERIFITAAKSTVDPDFLCFLLSKMTREQQFKVDPFWVLLNLLQWPFQTFFMEAADFMWDFISPGNYISLLKEIIQYSREFFGEFWQKSPTEFKRYVINDKHILIRLIREKDKKNLALILRDVTNIEKRKLVNCDSIHNLCKYFLRLEHWSSLEFFIRNCLFENSRNEMLQFKEEFESHIMSTDLEKVVKFKQEWDKIFEDIKSNPPKRLKRI